MAVLKYQDKDGNIKELDEVTVNYVADEWQPEPDWWDIDKILEEDEEEYDGKIICLLNNSFPTSTLYGWNANKIKTSDGVEYTNNLTTISHTWDTSKDKKSSQGYTTRYIIIYFSNNTIIQSHVYCRIPNETLYCIFQNMNITITNQNWGNGIFQNKTLLEFIKFKNTLFTNTLPLNSCYSLKGFENLNFNFNDWYGMTNLNSLPQKYILEYLSKCDYVRLNNNAGFANLYQLIELDLKNKFDNVPVSYVNSVTNCINLKSLKNIDLGNASFLDGRTIPNPNLINLEISNIKISGLNVTSCQYLSHESLINILNALYDYSNGETHTITLGSTNIAKLTEEELAIGQDKNWTIS